GTPAKDGANFSPGKTPTQEDVPASLLAQPIYVEAEGWLCHKVANCPANQRLEENLARSTSSIPAR
ncbi:hypothetical protein, partial [Synechococcus sp. F70.1]|uniref:hypothetical protein n=1 Tax=Synechococcus sp. F70.1 TaxID=2964532 RepID=UPI0039C6219B